MPRLRCARLNSGIHNKATITLVITTEIPEYRSTISIDYKTPEVLFEHGGIDGLQKKYVPRIKAKGR